MVIRPLANSLDGDGALLQPDLCLSGPLDFFQFPSGVNAAFKGLPVGPDFACGGEDVWRGFIRFDIASAPLTSSQVIFQAHMRRKASPVANLKLFEVEDFGNLAAGDFNGAIRQDFGLMAGPATPDETWFSVDVTSRYNTAKAEGRSHMAFRLQTETEGASGGVSRWYAVASTEEPTLEPRLGITNDPQTVNPGLIVVTSVVLPVQLVDPTVLLEEIPPPLPQEPCLVRRGNPVVFELQVQNHGRFPTRLENAENVFVDLVKPDGSPGATINLQKLQTGIYRGVYVVTANDPVGDWLIRPSAFFLTGASHSLPIRGFTVVEG